jgi:tetratricopeptide (TPR) repeat protein
MRPTAPRPPARSGQGGAAVAEEVFARNPDHPGAAHYLIHSYDDPIHAPLGVRAARAYSEIAPAAAHALHMPSHIFTALGLWDDVAHLNEASWAAADARRERKGLGVGALSYHALHWLEYAYLQQGRYREAREQLATATTDARQGDAEGVLAPRRHLAVMRAAYLIETRRWESPAANIEVDLDGLGRADQAADLFATGMAAVKAGSFARAQDALARMKPLLDGVAEPYAPGETAVAVMTHELDALLQLSGGRQDQALALMDAATAAEDAMPFDYGPAMPVKPSHELYGEMLLELDRPDEARAQFERALERTPRRALSLLGLSRAAAASGDATAAERAAADLRSVWHRADDDLADLKDLTAPAPGERR